MASKSVIPTDGPQKNTDMNPEYALNYLRGALEAHMASFTDDEQIRDRLQWGVTGLLEYSIKLLDEHVYGAKA